MWLMFGAGTMKLQGKATLTTFYGFLLTRARARTIAAVIGV